MRSNLLKFAIKYPLILIMRKQRSFEQNSMQNLQIQQQFDKLMQIQGLSLAQQAPKDPFPSLKSLFHANTSVNIIGQGPNANIRAFYYLLLCHIRKQHLTKLLNQQKMKQANQLELQDGCRRDRRVSFNNKTTVFLNGPQYQNYALHKLKIYAFSSSTDLMVINKSPFENQSVLQFKGKKLASSQLKKLLSEFLKQLLPSKLAKNYKQTLKSVRFYLNKHRVAGIILTIVMRYVLFSNYEIESAQNFQYQLNDHTVCTTLCDAFAINGLLFKQNLFEINTWCKVYSVNVDKGREFFVQVFNDQFQQLGITNDNQNAFNECRQVPIQVSISSSRKESEVIYNSQQQCAYYHLPSFQASPKSQSDNRSSSQRQRDDESSSMMEADEDSQISYGGEECKKAKDQLKGFLSDEFRSNDQHSNSVKDGFRQTFNSNRRNIQASILKEMENQQTQYKLEQDLHKKQEELQLNFKSLNQPQIKINLEGQQMREKNNIPQVSVQKVKEDENCVKNKRQTIETQGGYTSPSLMQKLQLPKTKTIKISKTGSSEQEERTNIVNNNISNNIYLTLGDNKPYIPVINITNTNNDPNRINIKLA